VGEVLPQSAASLGGCGLASDEVTGADGFNRKGGFSKMFKGSVIGNLGSDPEMKYAASGTPMLQMNVAANFRAKNTDGEWEERTEWIRCTVFGNRAESLSNLLKKGTRVYIDGRLEARPWTDRNGNVRAGLEISANDVELMSPRPADENRQPVAAGKGADDADLEDLPY
jgi:single-strand DNA-binding protein